MEYKKIYETSSGESIDLPFFTDDEKGQFRRELKKFDSDKVEKFISALQWHCQLFFFTQNAPSPTDHKKELKDMLESFRASLKYLKKLKDRKSQLNYIRKMCDMHSKYVSPCGKGSIDAMNSAIEANPHMERLFYLIQGLLDAGSRGRGAPQSPTTDLVIDIHLLYDRFIDEPKTTKFGTFDCVCALAIEAVGLDVEDVSRAVKTAIKKFRVHK